MINQVHFVAPRCFMNGYIAFISCLLFLLTKPDVAAQYILTARTSEKQVVPVNPSYRLSTHPVEFKDDDEFSVAEIKPLPLRAFHINALGILQFGPVFQAEYKVSNQGYIVPHVRLPYLGILYHVINADEDSDEVIVSPLALGIGMGYRHLFPAQKGAWYTGGVIEYSFGSSKGYDGSDWKSEFSNIAVMGNGGFRWRWAEKKSVISVGAYAGIYSALRDEWWYESNPEDVRDERSTSALFMLELSFGWER
jgi:hypothetical protein